MADSTTDITTGGTPDPGTPDPGTPDPGTAGPAGGAGSDGGTGADGTGGGTSGSTADSGTVTPGSGSAGAGGSEGTGTGSVTPGADAGSGTGSSGSSGNWKPPDIDVTISDEIRRLLASRAQQIQHVMRPDEYTVQQIQDIMNGIVYVPDDSDIDPATGKPKEVLVAPGLTHKIKDVATRMQTLAAKILSDLDTKIFSVTSDQITSLAVMYLKYMQQWKSFGDALTKKLSPPPAGGGSGSGSTGGSGAGTGSGGAGGTPSSGGSSGTPSSGGSSGPSSSGGSSAS